MDEDGTPSNSRDGMVARWTRKGSGARFGPIRSREPGPGRAWRICIRVLDLLRQATNFDRYSARSAGTQAEHWFGRVTVEMRSLGRRITDGRGEFLQSVIRCGIVNRIGFGGRLLDGLFEREERWPN